MPAPSAYEQKRVELTHRHRTNRRFRRRVAILVWSVATAATLLAFAVRSLVRDVPGPALTLLVAASAAATVLALARPAPAPHSHGLPGVPDGPCPWEAPGVTPDSPPPKRTDLGPFVIGSRIAGALTLLAFAAGLPAVVVLVPAVVVLVLALRVIVFALAVRSKTRRIARALAAHDPRFAIAYAGYGGGPTHLTMWEEPLLSAGFPGVVLNYREKYCAYLRQNTDLQSPFVQLSSDAIRDLEILIVPSLRWFFYLHNANSNGRFMAMPQVQHVWLGHGDSDKPASVFARHANYDLLVVSGTAAIDRYETAGVHIPREKFAILGRPQVREIESGTGPIGDIERPVVLYAPTWQGKSKLVNFSSLTSGPQIVKALIDAGAEVMFRPHPLSFRHRRLARIVHEVNVVLLNDRNDPSTPGQHLWGRQVTHDWSLNQCMNASDALVSDVSSVVSDWLQSGKPYAMVSTRLPAEEFREQYPVARGAYVIPGDLDGVDDLLADMLGPDSMAAVRDDLRERVLGGYRGHESAEAFAAYFRERFARVAPRG